MHMRERSEGRRGFADAVGRCEVRIVVRYCMHV